jgi:hypothetical protein
VVRRLYTQRQAGEQLDLLAVEVTALGSSRRKAIWSRPDIVTVEVRAFEYVPSKHLEINTFELKSPNAINIQAVYESLAHRRATTRSYVLLYAPTDLLETTSEAGRVRGGARPRVHGRRHPGGSHARDRRSDASDPSDYATWEEIEEAQRIEPDPERLDKFISEQFVNRRCCVAGSADALSAAGQCQIAWASSVSAASTREAGRASTPRS